MDELLAVMYCIDHVTHHLSQLALAELLPQPPVLPSILPPSQSSFWIS